MYASSTWPCSGYCPSLVNAGTSSPRVPSHGQLSIHHRLSTSSNSLTLSGHSPPWQGIREQLGPVGRWRRRVRASIACSAKEQQGDGEKKLSSWSWLPRGGAGAESVLRLIAGATSAPICQFIDSPPTPLHSVDPRIKLVWLLALVVVPARSHIAVRLGVVVFLSLISMWVLPTRVWMDQLGRVSLLSGIVFIMLGLGTDSAPPLVQLRSPPSHMLGLTDIPSSLEGYSYLIMKLGPLQLTRKGLSVASISASLSFTIFQSAGLCLATTAPEQLASALRWFMYPLTLIGVPVAEIILTLLLSLRFISLVFDEGRNAALGIISRRIDWKKLTKMETMNVMVTYVRRIFKNIFNHAEQISQAMIVRGFRGDSDTHKIHLFSDSSSRTSNIIALGCLSALVAVAVFLERFLV